jgi:CRISPR/Cas system CSM-associated protein Csm3 (group 7 of RAMP superfamily)
VFGSSVQIHRSCPKEGSSWDGILRREAELQLKKRTWDRWGQMGTEECQLLEILEEWMGREKHLKSFEKRAQICRCVSKRFKVPKP